MLPVPGQPFFLFLLSDELRDERYDSEMTIYASKCHRFRDPTSKFRVVSTQEKGRKKKVETLLWYSETRIKRTPSIKRTVTEVPKFIFLIYFKWNLY